MNKKHLCKPAVYVPHNGKLLLSLTAISIIIAWLTIGISSYSYAAEAAAETALDNGGYIRLPLSTPTQPAQKTTSSPCDQTATDIQPASKTRKPKQYKYSVILAPKWAGLDIPAVNVRYQIKNRAGKILAKGRTNDCGETKLIGSQFPEEVILELLHK